MRPLILAFPASLLLSLAPSAGAQTAAYPPADGTPISRVEVTAPPPSYRLRDDEADAVRGAYALSNGWRLKVTPTSRGINAQIDRERPMHLIALSPDKYVSRDGNVTMEFNRGDQGDDMLMSYVPNPLTAEVIVVRATMAQR